MGVLLVGDCLVARQIYLLSPPQMTWNKSVMYFGVNPLLTLYIKMSISCSLLLYNVVYLAFLSSVRHVSDVLLKTSL